MRSREHLTKNNPFSIRCGVMPKIFLSREDLLNEIMDSLYDQNGKYRSSYIKGQRGVGKTTFLNDIAKECEKDKDFVVISVMGTDDLLVDIYNNVTCLSLRLGTHCDECNVK